MLLNFTLMTLAGCFSALAAAAHMATAEIGSNELAKNPTCPKFIAWDYPYEHDHDLFDDDNHHDQHATSHTLLSEKHGLDSEWCTAGSSWSLLEGNAPPISMMRCKFS
jgi:hypothetical protein